MKQILIFALFTFLLAGFSCNPARQSMATGQQPLNIILLIGDGMGLAQLSTLYYFSEEPSQFSRFHHIGLHQNNASDAKVTDSAAAGTAFSIGKKTYNGAIGLDASKESHESILEMAARMGKSTGLVATSSITHATPAAFFAHVEHRREEEEIARQFLDAPVDYAAAGGIKFFEQRQDSLHLLDSLRARGVVVDTLGLLQDVPSDKRCAFFLAPNGMPKMTEGRGNFLPDATQQAIDRLSRSPKGFFLMVEGSQIDWGGHDNDATYVLEEMKDFNRAVGVALDFAARNGNTLVIVTADHETGGLSLSASQVDDVADYREIALTFSTKNHSASLIPVFAFGPGAEKFAGIYPNTAIFEKMREGF